MCPVFISETAIQAKCQHNCASVSFQNYSELFSYFLRSNALLQYPLQLEPELTERDGAAAVLEWFEGGPVWQSAVCGTQIERKEGRWHHPAK